MVKKSETHLDTKKERELRDRVRELEQRLAEREAASGRDCLHSSVFDNALVGVYRSTPDGRIIEANDALALMLGYSGAEELKRLVTNVAEDVYENPEDRERLKSLAESSRGSRFMDLRWRRRGGGFLYVRAEMRQVRDPQGRPLHYEGLVIDMTGQQAAQERLRESEQRFRIMAESASDWEYWIDDQGVFRSISPSCDKITGYPPEAFENDPDLLRRIVHPEDRDLWRRHTSEEVAEAEVMRARFRILRADGAVRWIGHSCSAVRDSRGRSLGRRVSNRDITAIKEREDELRKLHQAVEQSPLSIVITDLKGDIEYVNPYFSTLTGYAPEEVLGGNPRVLKSGRQPDELYREMWRTISSGKTWRGEFCNRTKSGREYWERAAISPITDEQGTTTHYLALKEDITEHREALNQLRISEERYREVVETTDNIVTRVDRLGRYTYLNAAARRMFGPDSGPGTLAFDSVHPEDRDLTMDAFRSWLSDHPEHVEFENRIIDAAGETRFIRWSISFRYDEEGGIRSTTAIGRDETERHNLDRLRQDVERITRHDLKSPLLSIMAVPQLLLDEGNLTGEQRELVQAVEESGYRMLRLINLSLDLYKIETGTYRLRPRLVDLRTVLRRVLDETGRGFTRREALLVRDNEPTDAPYPVFGEELLCHSLLANLTRNALEATPENGTVEIRLLRGDPARIEVHNRQPVPEQVRGTFFEKYATWGKSKGTGLGTYSARLLTEVQNGTIEMETSELKGTVVRVSLPRPPEWAR